MGRNRNFIEEEILDKAIVLFQEQGYNNTSPEQLVKVLGLSRSSLYSTFGDKRGLLMGALRRYQQLTAVALKNITSENMEPIEGVHRIFDVSIKGCYYPGMPGGCFLVNSIIEFGPEENGPLEIVQESYKDCRDALLHFLKLAKKSNPKYKDLDTGITADYLINAISGIAVSAKAGMDEPTCRRMADLNLSIF
ncbi:HTH-type transcriptional repressor ComR [compost metagenome]